MRLSATDRIIRDAEKAEEAKAGDRSGRGQRIEAQVGVAPPSAAAIPERHGSPADFELELGDPNGGDENTRVDRVRSAEALDTLRSLEMRSQRTVIDRVAADRVAPDSGRVSLRADSVRLPPAAAPARSPALTKSKAPARRRPAGLPPGRPKASAAVRPVEAPPLEDHSAVQAPASGPLVDAPPPPMAVRSRLRVGRTMGIVIAAATAAAVAQVVGAWTSLPGKAAVAETSGTSTSVGATSTSSPTHAATGPAIAVILPAQPAAVPPATEPAPSSPGSPLVGSSAPGSSPASGERNRGQEPTAVKKSRPGRKAAASKTARRKAHAAKAGGSASRSGPRPIGGIGAPAPAARKPAATPVTLHPDDVMPIGDS